MRLTSHQLEPNPAATQAEKEEAEEEEEEEEQEEESAEMMASRRAAASGAAVVIDVKDPASCLGWSLVRRALRCVGTGWSRRMNCYSVGLQSPSSLHV